MRRTKEQRIADMEAEAAALKRKLRMETVPGVKEAVLIAKALRKWDADFHGQFGGNTGHTDYAVTLAAAWLEQTAEEPQ